MTTEFDKALADVVTREIPDCTELVSVERLSAGASQETYRLVIASENGERLLCLRRQPGGVRIPASDFHTVGSATEALLITAAREVGVPEPQIHYVLIEADGLGEGFLMQWLEGETLGSRIARSSAFDGVRPSLAHQCGEILARIHAIDVDAVGLADRLPRESPEGSRQADVGSLQALRDRPNPMVDYTARWFARTPTDGLPTDAGAQRPSATATSSSIPTGESPASSTGEFANIGDPLRDLGWICVNSWRFGRPRARRRLRPLRGLDRRLRVRYRLGAGPRARPLLAGLRFVLVVGDDALHGAPLPHRAGPNGGNAPRSGVAVPKA